jgi:hypothetical protein
MKGRDFVALTDEIIRQNEGEKTVPEPQATKNSDVHIKGEII